MTIELWVIRWRMLEGGGGECGGADSESAVICWQSTAVLCAHHILTVALHKHKPPPNGKYKYGITPKLLSVSLWFQRQQKRRGLLNIFLFQAVSSKGLSFHSAYTVQYTARLVWFLFKIFVLSPLESHKMSPFWLFLFHGRSAHPVT